VRDLHQGFGYVGPTFHMIMVDQFERLRDGDRFFYQNDPVLRVLNLAFGVDYRHTLAEIVSLNTDATVPANVFKFAP